MKEIKKKIESLNTAISEIQEDEHKEIFNKISEIIEDLSSKIEDVMVNEAVLAENFKYMNDDISNLQEELFEEVSIEDLEDLEDMEDEYKEVTCKNCGKKVFIEESAIKENKEIPCPYCNKNII